MNRLLLVIAFQYVVIVSFGQENRYVVYFKDKEGTPFTVNEPLEFLSERAILRRQKQNIAITLEDLPVNSWYLDSLKKYGAEVYYTSRWFNAALIQATPEVVNKIQTIKIVDFIDYAAPDTKLSRKTGRLKFNISSTASSSQLEMHNIDSMHQEGYKGEGVWIAIMDGGFAGVDAAAPFLHLYAQDKLVLTKNFIQNNSDVYQYSDHGTKVLSLISGQIKNEFTGIATDAHIGLFVTEDMEGEYRIEEYNWLFAAEMADSAGFDIINTSLGYYTFDDPSMDYEYSDLDGMTAVITRASDLASERGILVVTSAGNEGDEEWKHITFPGDAFNNITVGAVTPEGWRAGFSSTGPTADNRRKPDISALGTGVNVINSAGNLTYGQGTSFASPIVAAMAAGIWQKYPELSMAELHELILSWGTNIRHDNFIGRGLVYYELPENMVLRVYDHETVGIYPNPVSDKLYLSTLPKNTMVTLYDKTGRSLNVTLSENFIYLDTLPAGLYILTLSTPAEEFIYRIIKE